MTTSATGTHAAGPGAPRRHRTVPIDPGMEMEAAPTGVHYDSAATRWLRRLLTGVAAGSGLGMIALTAGGPLDQNPTVFLGWLNVTLLLLIYGTVAVIGRTVTVRAPHNPVGWLIFLVGVMLLLSACSEWYARHGLVGRGSALPGGPHMAVLSVDAIQVGTICFLVAVALFPSGRPVGAVGRVLLWLTVTAEAISDLVDTLRPGPVVGWLSGEAVTVNPFAVSSDAVPVTAIGDALLPITLPALALVALGSLIVRLHRSPPGPQRQQIKLALLGAGFTAVALPLDPVIGAQGFLYGIGLVSLPISMGVAMMRYRLYAVDTVINRTLLYGTLTALLIAIYIAVLSVVDAIGHVPGTPVTAAAATGIAALSLMPLYLALRRVVNRLTFGIREDPRRVLGRVGRRLAAAAAPDEVLPTAAAELARALRLPTVQIDIRDGDILRPAAVAGETRAGSAAQAGVDRTRDRSPQPAGMSWVPLTYRGDLVGRLGWIGPPPGGSLPPGCLETITDLAPQIAAAVAAARLTDELRRSRDRLLTARAVERNRIRRDLHDGLGPTLAAIGIQAELAEKLQAVDPATSALALADLRRQAAAGVAEIRRIIDGLHPAPLEELGLPVALVHCARTLSPTITVRCSGELTTLPIPLQAAAYRIAVEAMTNAARHARARTIEVSVVVAEGQLSIRVADDGAGLPEPVRTGTGLSSMRARAAELGGWCTIGPTDPVGTTVLADLPVAP